MIDVLARKPVKKKQGNWLKRQFNPDETSYPPDKRVKCIPIKNALTPAIVEYNGEEFSIESHLVDNVSYVEPDELDPCNYGIWNGILVSGPNLIPQFLKNEDIRLKDGRPDYRTFDRGLLVLYADTPIRFRCDDTNTVYRLWKPEAERLRKKREERYDEKKRIEKNCWIVIFCVCCVVLLVVAIGISVGLYYLISYIVNKLSSGELQETTTALSMVNETTTVIVEGLANTTETTPTLTTTTSVSTTTTKTYPSLSNSKRSPIVALPAPTYTIDSFVVEMNIKTTNPSNPYADFSVSFVLNAFNVTEKVHLHCAVTSFSRVTAPKPGKPAPFLQTQYDKETQILTITLERAVIGTEKIQILYKPSVADLDRISFPCDAGTCMAYGQRQLKSIVPHFDYSMRHKWTIKVSHPASVKVVSNTVADKSASSETNTVFPETSPLFPHEVSLMIMNNFGKNQSGTQVNYYISDKTDLKEGTELADTLATALKGEWKSLVEIFSIVVVPAMENFQFYGRNVALVGSSLLKSSQETKLIFIWSWIFRMVLYKKVTSSDTNPTWIYEQSAFFLSTNYKSQKKHLWRKHLYESAIESSRSGTNMPFNMKIAYEDERKYFEKAAYVAKVSTVLAMITSINTGVSEDVLTDLDKDRNGATSAYYFFLKSQKKLANGKVLDVDKFATCYIDSLEVPGVHVIRSDKSHVVIQRANGGQKTGCDKHVWYVERMINTNIANKEYALLSNDATTIEVKSDSPILLSGDSPYSAYGYSMEQKEFDKLLDTNALASYDQPSIELFAFNSFRAAAEGKLSYESLKRFMDLLLLQKVFTVDAAVDMWMWTVAQSRNTKLTSLTNAIVASVLNATGQPADSKSVALYIVERFDKAVKEDPPFKVGKSAQLIKHCGKLCFRQVESRHYENFECATENTEGCYFNLHFLEIYVCKQIASEGLVYKKYADMYANCTGKSCRLPVLRGLFCTQDRTVLEGWLYLNTTSDLNQLDERQVVSEIFKGLASNDVSKPMLLPFLFENWHVLHEKYSRFPALLGDITESLLSGINQLEELEQLKQFVAFHGENLNMYTEFEDQIFKAEKVLAWNKNFSELFSKLFN